MKRLTLALCLATTFGHTAPKKEEPIDPKAPVSFYKQVRPIFQGSCNGCHQPAKAKGGYVMTDFTALLKGGEEGSAIVIGQPEKSNLITLITTHNGKAEMPQKAEPLHATQVELIGKWIKEGAKDDTPASARQQFTAEHPPTYTTAPLIPSLDYSPDGQLIAVAGYHEVLLHKADGTGLAARLVGLSERIQKVAFSPDGKKLAVAGGNPARMGEVQVWDVEKRKLDLSHTVTYDSLYGVSWSPDSKLIAFGCGDNTVRAIEATTGKQVLFMGSHSDWVLDTAWGDAGKHIVSVGRDMAVKLTEVATQRFVDNITSITPGALKGGVHAVARHPTRNEVLVGGTDGIPQIYRMERITKRVIGDNANLIRKFPTMHGRIFAVDYSPDGKRIAAAASHDFNGAIHIYSADFDPTLPPEVKKIVETTNGKGPELDAYITKDIKLLSSTPVPTSGIYTLAFSPDGKELATAGADGRIRILNAMDGKPLRDFLSVPLVKADSLAASEVIDDTVRAAKVKAQYAESLPAGAKVTSIKVEPETISLSKVTEYAQLLITAQLSDGTQADITRIAKLSLDQQRSAGTPARSSEADKRSQPPLGTASVDERGMVKPLSDGTATLTVSYSGKTTSVPVKVASMSAAFHPDYVRDIMPIASKLGCNMGTCHGSKEGKNGFKLSLRGYDPLYDVLAFTDELAGRRANVAAPDSSLMLLKASGSVPHEGGQLTVPGERYYEALKAWISDGAKVNFKAPKVASIQLYPQNPVIQKIGSRQQMRILATYADGYTRDVTAEAFIESGNTEVAEADKAGLLTTLRRGEAPILARFEGNYAATTVTVMGDRSGFEWKQPETWNRIDELVAQKWQRMKIAPSGLCTDADYIRRIHIDLTGLPPTAEATKAFLADKRDTQTKRYELVDKLIGSADFVDHWTNKWADMLQVNSKFLGAEGATALRSWIKDQVSKNTPYDQFAHGIMTAAGSNKDNPAASYFKVLRTPEDTMENTTHLWLATRFNCNKCHDHPFERWTQDQYYQTAAFFAQVQFTPDPKAAGATIGGTAVEGAKPLFEIIQDATTGDVLHDRTKAVTPPLVPYDVQLASTAENQKSEIKNQNSRRETFAKWLTSPENDFFAMSYANRIWGYLTGTGVIEPLDDIRAGNPPTNPELLRHLTDEFVKSGFNVRHLMRHISQSRTYQLSLDTNKWNADDSINYSHAKARRLPAEVLFDAVHTVTGHTPRIPGIPPGTRAAQLADAQVKLPDGFLGNFGRPVRESVCECERSNDVNLGPVMALMSGPTVGDAISSSSNAISKLVSELKDDRQLIDAIFMRVLNRPATEKEIAAAMDSMKSMAAENQSLATQHLAKEAEQKPHITAAEAARAAAISTAKEELAAYQKAQEPILTKAKADREAAIKAAQATIAKSAKAAEATQANWENRLDFSTEWVPLMQINNAAKGIDKLVQDKDGTFRAQYSSLPPGQNVVGNYNINFKTELQGITAFKIEALPDPTLPNNGPGLSDGDGNFVVSQITITAKPLGAPRAGRREGAIDLIDAQADFNQDGFDPKLALKVGNRDKGWAVAPQVGMRHELILSAKEPIGFEKGTMLGIQLAQNYPRGRYLLGKFRIYATTAKSPRFGVNSQVAEALRSPKRSPQQTALITQAYLEQHPDYQLQQKNYAAASKPLPADPTLAAKQQAVAHAERPITLDPQLLQLRRDAQLSQTQLSSPRLTAAQDLTWALINSPAFLFNH